MAEQTITLGDSIMPIVVAYRNTSSSSIDSTYTPTESRKGLAPCFTRTSDYLTKTFTISGVPDTPGDYTIVFRVGGSTAYPEKVYVRATIHVLDPTCIESVEQDPIDMDAPAYDLQGRKVGTLRHLQNNQLPRGIYIVGRKKFIVE